MRGAAGRRPTLVSATVFTAGGGHHRVDAGGQTRVEIPRAETRDDFRFNDSFAERVGQRTFQTVASDDAEIVALLKSEKDRPIFAVFPPDLPVLREAYGVLVRRGLRREPLIDGDDDLIRSLALKLHQFSVEPRNRFRADHSGEIVAMVRRWGRQTRGGGDDRSTERGDESPPDHPDRPGQLSHQGAPAY